jgi:hypothetical protein
MPNVPEATALRGILCEHDNGKYDGICKIASLQTALTAPQSLTTPWRLADSACRRSSQSTTKILPFDYHHTFPSMNLRSFFRTSFDHSTFDWGMTTNTRVSLQAHVRPLRSCRHPINLCFARSGWPPRQPREHIRLARTAVLVPCPRD